jgi:hypothetical protein
MISKQLKTGTWIRPMGCVEWYVRCPGAQPHDKVEVRAKSGKSKVVKIGRRALNIAPDGVFHLGTPDTIESVNGERDERRLIVDGVELGADGVCRTIWEGDTKSLSYKLRLGVGVLHDVYTITVWCHASNRYVQHPLISDGRYPVGMPWHMATDLLIKFWNEK